MGEKGPARGLNWSNFAKISSILAIFGTRKWYNDLYSIDFVRSHQNTLNLSKIIHNPVIWRPEIGQNGPKIAKNGRKVPKIADFDEFS